MIRPIAFKPLGGRLSAGGERYGSTPVLASRPPSHMTLYGSKYSSNHHHFYQTVAVHLTFMLKIHGIVVLRSYRGGLTGVIPQSNRKPMLENSFAAFREVTRAKIPQLLFLFTEGRGVQREDWKNTCNKFLSPPISSLSAIECFTRKTNSLLRKSVIFVQISTSEFSRKIDVSLTCFGRSLSPPCKKL